MPIVHGGATQYAEYAVSALNLFHTPFFSGGPSVNDTTLGALTNPGTVDKLVALMQTCITHNGDKNMLDFGVSAIRIAQSMGIITDAMVEASRVAGATVRFSTLVASVAASLPPGTKGIASDLSVGTVPYISA